MLVAISLAVALSAFILSIMSAGFCAYVAFYVLHKKASEKLDPGETTVEVDVPQAILDQMPHPRQTPQTVAEYTRMLREAQPEFLFDSED